MELFLCILLALCGFTSGAGALALWLLLRRETPPAVHDKETEPEPRSNRLTPDQGFENLMAYQVGMGRGNAAGGEGV